MAGIDAIGNPEIDRLAPRPADVVGPDRVDRPALVVRIGRQIDEVAVAVPAKIDRPDRSELLAQRGADRCPVDQVGGMPDHQPRIGKERRERHVVIVAILEDRRVGMVAGDDGIEVSPVAKIGLALSFDALAPSRTCRATGRIRRLRKRQHRQRRRDGACGKRLEQISSSDLRHGVVRGEGLNIDHGSMRLRLVACFVCRIGYSVAPTHRHGCRPTARLRIRVRSR
jgi:hypothetical protein